MNKSLIQKILPFLPYILIISTSILVFLPFLLGDHWFKSHDGIRYILIFSEFKESFLNGQLYPRWQANMYGGYGYPSFCFYQPGYFYLLLLISLFIKNSLPLICASVMALFSLGGIGAYKLARHFCGRICSLFISLIYLCTPYIYVNLFVRGDFSELAAMLISPWPYFLLLALKKKYDEKNGRAVILYAIWLGLSLCAIIMTHPATALFTGPCVFILSAVLCLKDHALDLKFAKTCVLAFTLSVVLSSPYWITLFQLKPYANFEGIGEYFTRPFDHIVHWKQFLSTQWDYTYSNAGPSDGMSFQLGWVHALLAVLGFICARKNKFIATSFVLYLALVLLMSPLSVWIWQHAPVISYIQFPWRILSITGTLQLICLCGLGYFLQSRRAALKYGLMVLIIAATIFVHHQQFIFISSGSDAQTALDEYAYLRLRRFTGLNSENEFLPKNAKLQELRNARGDLPMVMMVPPERIEPLPGNSAYHIGYTFSNQGPAVLVINQFYFPGWKIVLNGKPLDRRSIEENLSPAGLMGVKIAPGENQRIEAYYDGPPFRRLRTLFVLALSGLIVFGIRKVARK